MQHSCTTASVTSKIKSSIRAFLALFLNDTQILNTLAALRSKYLSIVNCKLPASPNLTMFHTIPTNKYQFERQTSTNHIISLLHWIQHGIDRIASNIEYQIRSNFVSKRKEFLLAAHAAAEAGSWLFAGPRREKKMGNRWWLSTWPRGGGTRG